MTRHIALLFVLLTATASPGYAQRGAPQDAAEPTGVDAVVALLDARMSESLILNVIQNSGETYALKPADLVRLQKAGATEPIIEAMLTPTAPAPEARPAAAPAPAPAARRSSPPAGQAAAPTEERRGGLMGRIGTRLRRTAERTVDNTVASVEETVDDTATAVDEGVDKKLGEAEEEADSATKRLTGTDGESNRRRR